MDREAFTERVRQKMRDHGIRSERALCQSAGVSVDFLRNIREGKSRSPSHEKLQKVAHQLGVTLDWLMGQTDDEKGLAEEPAPKAMPATTQNLNDGMVSVGGVEWVSVPRFDAAVSAGPGAIIDPNAPPLGYALFEAQWLRAITRAMPDSLAVVKVDGDSMDPALRDGDWVLVDRSQRKPNREGIYALAVGDTVWVKRLTLNLRERLIQVISDNPTYPIQELTEEELCVLGRVVWIVGRKV